MNPFNVKSTFLEKCKEAIRLLKQGGIMIFLRKCARYGRHLLGEQSHFVYFAFSLDRPLPSFHLQDIGNVRLADRKDSARIQSELFPFITEEEENDKYLKNFNVYI